MKIIQHLGLPLTIAALIAPTIVPAIAQSPGSDGDPRTHPHNNNGGDETTCGLGLRQAFFRTFHYRIWVCQDPTNQAKLTLVLSPQGRITQKTTAQKVGDSYNATANEAQYVMNPQTLEIVQNGKTVVQETVLETAGSDAAAAAQIRKCNVAIDFTLTKLKSIPNTQNVQYTTSPMGDYANPPRPNPQLQRFTFRGAGAASILNSPKLRLAMGERLLRDCPNFDAVMFGLERSGAYVIYGSVNQKIQPFTCIPIDDAPKGKLKWGETICS
jgi:hypothetical protein